MKEYTVPVVISVNFIYSTGQLDGILPFNAEYVGYITDILVINNCCIVPITGRLIGISITLLSGNLTKLFSANVYIFPLVIGIHRGGVYLSPITWNAKGPNSLTDPVLFPVLTVI